MKKAKKAKMNKDLRLIIIVPIFLVGFLVGLLVEQNMNYDVEVFQDGRPVLSLCYGVVQEQISIDIHDGLSEGVDSGTLVDIMFTTGKIYFTSFTNDEGNVMVGYFPTESIKVTGCYE